MPNVSRSRTDGRFRRTWSSRWKRFVEWLKRLLLYGRLDWRKASDDAKPPRLTAAERAAYQPRFEVNAIKPRSVSAADLTQPVAPAPEPAPASPAPGGLSIDPSLLAAAISAVQQQQQAASGESRPLDPAQVAAALQALQQAGLNVPAAAAAMETGVRSQQEIREAERDHARRYKRRRRSRSSRARVNPLTAFDSSNLPPSALESKVDKWLGR